MELWRPFPAVSSLETPVSALLRLQFRNVVKKPWLTPFTSYGCFHLSYTPINRNDYVLVGKSRGV